MNTQLQPQGEFYTPETGIVGNIPEVSDSQIAQAGQEISAENPFANIQPPSVEGFSPVETELPVATQVPEAMPVLEATTDVLTEASSPDSIPTVEVAPQPQEASMDSSFTATPELDISDQVSEPEQPITEPKVEQLSASASEFSDETAPTSKERAFEDPDQIFSEFNEDVEALVAKIDSFIDSVKDERKKSKDTIRDLEENLRVETQNTQDEIKRERAKMAENQKRADMAEAMKARLVGSRNPSELLH